MSLRSPVLHGGLYLVMREGMGMAISLGALCYSPVPLVPSSTVSLQQPLGFYYCQNVNGGNIAVYLVRREGRKTLTIPSGFLPFCFARTGSNASGISP